MAILKEGVTVGSYVVERVLPGGGFSQVVVARRRSSSGLRELVALKIARTNVPTRDPTKAAELLEIYSRSLENEVETLRQLWHPGVVHIFPIQVDDHRRYYIVQAQEIKSHPLYFVMEYLKGGSVKTLVKHQGLLPLPLTVEIAQQVCSTLDYVHTKGFAHLDIKASNILLRESIRSGSDDSTAPEAVLVDFGAAQRVLRRAEVEASTLVYLSPERVKVMKGITPPESVTDKSAADVYAMGVVFYYMLTGRLPFSGRRSHVTTAILRDSPTRPTNFNVELKHAPGLEELIMNMLEKRPVNRPRAADVAALLDRLVPPPRFGISGIRDAVYEKHEAGRLKQFALGFLSALLISGIGGGGMYYYKWSRPTPTPEIPTSGLPTPVGLATEPIIAASPTTVAATLTPLPTRPVLTATPTHAPTPTPTLAATATSVATFTPTLTPRPTSTPTPAPPPK